MAIWITRQSTAVPKAAAEEIEVLLDYSERLDEFISAARRQSVAVTPVEVIASISQELGVSNDVLRKVFNSLENFKNLSEEFGGSDKMLDDLILNLNEKIAANLKERRTSIVQAVGEYERDNAVSLSYKAQRLTYMRENVYQQAEIITDARPVFDEKGQKIVEYIIAHYLVITYFRHGVTTHPACAGRAPVAWTAG